MITADDWGWRYAGRSSWAVRGASLHIADGERVLLLGASGSGKSTLLAALAGVLGGADEGTETGRLLIDGKHPSRLRGRVGLVMQDPESQVVLARVGDDVAFGCENLGMSPEQIWPRVHQALDAVNLPLSLEHPTGALSGGQKQRLAIAAALAMQPAPGDPGGSTPILCLDEPTANLDPQGIREVRDAIGRVVADRRTTLVVVEHRIDLWADLVDRIIVLGPGEVIADGPAAQVLRDQTETLLAAGVWVPGVPTGLDPRTTPASPGPVLVTEHLRTGYEASHPVSDDLRVAVPEGLSTVITGPNGAGKSTLALTLAGLLRPLGGKVIAGPSLRPTHRGRHLVPADPHTWTSRDLLTRLGTVFQQPEHQFVERSVRAELAVGLRALGWDTGRAQARVDELLSVLHLEAHADANPFTLSGGEQRRLSVGTVLATSPQVIVLDEPTFGQDRNTWSDLVGLVRGILDEGRTIVSVTHDRDYLDVLGEHEISLTAERIAA
ncbi:ATP-binding cassette domain-containing protein [Brooklawnia cerclae]|uniref:Energy-coupling factor transport system ATP-binding protein n=1 Tax=Brooklawnia cerclae TaxID=349934 RepID=A0ABX0SFW8_9ACTN|nr:ABC transporter ATP-binding protein [Brooklawnia cerclae]NIH55582.1 energy-coupling factor transport system ATP-binding protein [Brooklawnia cerclae]